MPASPVAMGICGRLTCLLHAAQHNGAPAACHPTLRRSRCHATQRFPHHSSLPWAAAFKGPKGYHVDCGVEAKCNGSWSTNETLPPAGGNVATSALRILFGVYFGRARLPLSFTSAFSHLDTAHRVQGGRFGIPAPRVRMIHEAGKGT